MIFDQVFLGDEAGPLKLFMTDFGAHSSSNSMLTVNVNFLYCCESIAVVALLMPYYKEDLDKKQKCRGH